MHLSKEMDLAGVFLSINLPFFFIFIYNFFYVSGFFILWQESFLNPPTLFFCFFYHFHYSVILSGHIDVIYTEKDKDPKFVDMYEVAQEAIEDLRVKPPHFILFYFIFLFVLLTHFPSFMFPFLFLIIFFQRILSPLYLKSGNFMSLNLQHSNYNHFYRWRIVLILCLLS